MSDRALYLLISGSCLAGFLAILVLWLALA